MKAKNNKIKLSTIKRYETNPFILELEDKMYLQPKANMVIAKGQSLVEDETGYVLKDTPMIGKRKIVDKSQFAKIYATEIGVLFNLSKTAINVFMYLTSVMDYDNKAIFSYTKEYKKLNYKTEVPCLKGLKELIKNNIIAVHIVSNIYWLNPLVVCKGERFAMYQEVVTKEYAEKEGFATPEQKLQKQGRENMQKLPENTQNKLKAMNKRANREAIEDNPYGDTMDMFSNDNSPYKK